MDRDPMDLPGSGGSRDAGAPAPLTERERAIRALVSGAILGVVLALLGRAR
jgi:hypothetical protein